MAYFIYLTYLLFYKIRIIAQIINTNLVMNILFFEGFLQYLDFLSSVIINAILPLLSVALISVTVDIRFFISSKFFSVTAFYNASTARA